MKNALILVYFMITCNVSGQIYDVVAEDDTRNGNGYYTTYSVALERANDVKTLDIEKSDANDFLRSKTYFPNLVNLNLHFSKGVSQSRDFENFANLETITISYSWYLSSLPSNFTALKALKKVYIYNCGLSVLPELFFSNPTLQSVGICGNKLTKLPVIPVNNEIQYLNIGYNEITQLPASFENLKKIKILSLKGLPIETFPEEILKLTELESLELTKTKIAVLPKEIAKLKNLQNLYLVGMNLRSIPSGLKKSKLTNVWISEDDLSEKEKNDITNSLPKECKIEWTSKESQLLDINEKCFCER
ncbi:leucine-rich repeat domain-containing protein [Flavobacterium sp. SLB02]|uniref:leucine-rich repeat domain-containing protein n=1 Tax=Flavobacterium sp. SLB02 TaxID=2665645 RepID=UPI0012AA7F5F|nr:leucine-rich repeat domain-containing protein [Flavobacterium sp. SLB02]QGK74019.1 hypothetical protein GIY83_08110 [Flavobacterium sp. SLB02]